MANGGTITTLNNAGAIKGGSAAELTADVGVRNTGSIAILTNSGTITGGAGEGTSGIGGSAISNYGAITSALTNTGTITGGSGGNGLFGSAAGAGLMNDSSETFKLLNNKAGGTIVGGVGGFGFGSGGGAGAGGSGGIGVSNAGTITTLHNSGAITGGAGGNGATGFGTASGGAGGAAISNIAGGLITTLTNFSGAKITGGKGGSGNTGGAGGDGVFNAGTITTLNNQGAILGGNGGGGSPGGAAGLGLDNIGTITTIHNTGTIGNGVHGFAVFSTGRIGSIDNSGLIDGAVLLGAGGVTLTNSGDISGAVTFAGPMSALDNSGRMTGGVNLGDGNSLTDTGVIDGDIVASAGDLLAFGGHFGNVTIKDFDVAGANHDTLLIETSGAGALSAGPVPAMSQSGSNVVIRVDASDSITLTDASLPTLTGADLRFV